MNAARNARKQKHIRTIRAALRFREETKQRLVKPKAEHKATKEYIVGKIAADGQHKKDIVRVALNNAREDWKLGPLRPNRAVGTEQETYGVFHPREFQSPAIPEHWYGAEERVQKRMKTRIPANVFRNEWPIVEGDRVVIVRGRSVNKIGTVKEIDTTNNTLLVTDVNKVWVDGRAFNQQEGEEPQPRREWESPIPYDDVRLLMQQDVLETVDGAPVLKRQDIIVEAIDMQKHTTGIDPFTGQFAEKIPEDHQVDPVTGEVIWHRFIAGTRKYIEWPWQAEARKEQEAAKSDKSTQKLRELGLLKTSKERAGAHRSIVRSLLRKLNPLPLLRRANPLRLIRGKPRRAVQQYTAEEQKARRDQRVAKKNALPEYNAENVFRGKPAERDPVDYEADTKRNQVELDESHPDYFVPTLVYPPMPETVIEELSELHMTNTVRAELDPAAADAYRIEQKEYRETKKAEKQARINTMKTPMQIRWELDQAKKVVYDPAAPKAPSQSLLLALGKHMAAKKADAQPKKSSSQPKGFSQPKKAKKVVA